MLAICDSALSSDDVRAYAALAHSVLHDKGGLQAVRVLQDEESLEAAAEAAAADATASGGGPASGSHIIWRTCQGEEGGGLDGVLSALLANTSGIVGRGPGTECSWSLMAC